ncbi:MAG: hypothetical protein NC911_09655 [Candidatus Omnitrophica bacterium]|nr:hypothetical protein [Candidatus Omnitrophota bacterium]
MGLGIILGTVILFFLQCSRVGSQGFNFPDAFELEPEKAIKELLQPARVTAKIPKSIPNARQQAILLAKRQAVAQAAGEQLESAMLLQNDELRRYLAIRTEGYIHEYNVVEETVEGDYLVVTIEAWVKKLPLNKDLLFKNLPVKAIYEWAGKPRVTLDVIDKVAYESKGEAKAYDLPITEGELKDLLGKMEIVVKEIPADRLTERYQQEVELLIKGVSVTRLGSSQENPDGKGISYRYFNILQLTAYELPGMVSLVSKNYDQSQILPEDLSDLAASSPDEAVKKAIFFNSRRNIPDFARLLVKAWYEKVNKPTTVNVEIRGFSNGQEVNTLYDILSRLDDVFQVRLRAQLMDRSEFEAEFRGTVERFAGLFEKYAAMKNLSLNRLTLHQEKLVYERKSEKPYAHRFKIAFRDITQQQLITFLASFPLQVANRNDFKLVDGQVTLLVDYVGTLQELANLVARSMAEIEIVTVVDDTVTAKIRHQSGVKIKK